ncbi:MAG: alpha/beta hydrolase [Rhodospirillaceae bacterium]|jgi:pimeloyl-ACP methyl ester carboxylesterase|nr:alpha/beta hydrolase [Rhodospirillaceae bacterium]MBT6139854.1 alpha/beta hydrolase [Rhodospirillaceae bacterium]
MELTVAGTPAFAATGGRPFDTNLPVLVLVHGAGMDHTVWAMQARYFAHRGYSVLALDLAGHGRSAGKPLMTVEEIADWVIAVADAAGVSQAPGSISIAGHSLGAMIALETVARLGERAAALLLLGTNNHIAVNPALLEAAQNGDHSAIEIMIGWGFGRRAQIGGHRAPGAWAAGGGLRLLEAGNLEVLAKDLAASNDYTAGLEAAARVTCRTLLVMGEDDRMTPVRTTGSLLEALGTCETMVLKGAGHMMLVEQPDETLDAMIDFLRGT